MPPPVPRSPSVVRRPRHRGVPQPPTSKKKTKEEAATKTSHDGGGEWQVGSNYKLSKIEGVDSRPVLAAVARMAAGEIERTLKPAAVLEAKHREQSGLLARKGGDAVSFRWKARVSNKPTTWYYWTELHFALEVTEVATGKVFNGIKLVFDKRINKTGWGILGVLAYKIAT